MKFKLYKSKSEYTKSLNLINEEMGFPSKKYQKYIRGRLRKFTSNKIMTRTWADENPKKTLQNKYPMPIEGETTLTGLVDYNENWYPDESIIKKL